MQHITPVYELNVHPVFISTEPCTFHPNSSPVARMEITDIQTGFSRDYCLCEICLGKFLVWSHEHE